MQIIVILLIIIFFISELTQLISNFKTPIIIAVVTIISLYLIFKIYENSYFNSEKFKSIKRKIQNFIDNCNELNDHIEELKKSYINIKSYDYGDGFIYDDSNYEFKRKEWNSELKNYRTHNCSASVCKNAKNQPFKYLCKYFDIEKTDKSLSQFEKVLNDFSAAEEGKKLLRDERDFILNNIESSIPLLIVKLSYKRLIKELGFKEVDLSDLYFPVYTFLYVSPGGNSSLKVDIKLDVRNLEKFIFYLKDLIKFRKSILGQRALMTSSLREKIKIRDNYTCQICELSIYDEKNLLLEIDHIIPLSKGGITEENNLQTLCWKCNRSKGSKILGDHSKLRIKY